ncbi:uncharacterized protein FPOAC1_013586 [Fusarium poae]|jgi:hypothetical protein|nr:uncharacterized protein FPOAC1_013586 [Fusarium poae]KAG8664806.1 hypothetical protein FPOAC1_013586 [Fusarium poae]
MAATIDLKQVAAAVEWQYNGATQYLTNADPKHAPIRFTLRVNATENEHHCALLDLIVPVKFKDKQSSAGTSAICLRINPPSITSLDFSTKTDLPKAIEQIFPSSAICLDLQFDSNVIVLIPSLVKEPPMAARQRSGKIIDLLYELSHVTTLRVYIQDSLLSLDQLNSLKDIVTQRQLQPFSGREDNISRMFSETGAKITNLAASLPSAYNKATTQPEPPSYEKTTATSSSHKRKRSQEVLDTSNSVWDQLQKLETLIHDRTAQIDQSKLVHELQTEIIQLREKLTRCEKICADLEAEVAVFREAQGNADDAEDVELIEMRDDIKALGNRMDFIERGKDDVEFGNKIKLEVFDELAARVLRG